MKAFNDETYSCITQQSPYILNFPLNNVRGVLNRKYDANMTSFSGVSKFFLCLRDLGETLPLSSGNKITLKFTANGTGTAKGFHFVYQGKTI